MKFNLNFSFLKPMLTPGIVLVALVLFSSCESKPQGTVTVIDATYLEAQLNVPNLQLLDVRTAEEFSQGYIEGAINLDIKQEEQFLEGVQKLDKSAPVYLYCMAGGRSNRAAEKLLEMGFTSIYDFSGGYRTWAKKQQPE